MPSDCNEAWAENTTLPPPAKLPELPQEAVQSMEHPSCAPGDLPSQDGEKAAPSGGFQANLLIGNSIDDNTEEADEAKCEEPQVTLKSFFSLSTPGMWIFLFLLFAYCPIFAYIFHSVEGWNAWQSYVFAGSIITTIGYGNVTPGTDAGKVLVILCGITGIPLVLVAADYISKLLLFFIRRGCEAIRLHLFGIQPPVPQGYLRLAFAVWTVLYFTQSVVVYFCMEDWKLLDCIYFVFVKTSTVGFGDFIPVRRGSYSDVPPITWYHVWHSFCTLLGLSMLTAWFQVVKEGFERRYAKGYNASRRALINVKSGVGRARLERYIKRQRLKNAGSDPVWNAIRHAMEKLTSSHSLEDALLSLDVDGSGTLNEEEWISVCRQVLDLEPTEAPMISLRAAFRILDVDQSGTLELAEFYAFLDSCQSLE